MTGPLKNDQGEISGAKLVLLAACVMAMVWLARDLVTGREMTEWTFGALGILLLVGLVNRMSARGRFRIRVKDVEVESHDERDHGRP